MDAGVFEGEVVGFLYDQLQKALPKCDIRGDAKK